MAEQAPPLPFLDAIKARGAAPPSANRPANAPVRKSPAPAAAGAGPINQPKLPVKQATTSPNKKTSGVFKNKPAPPTAVSPKAPSPSAKALLDGLKSGQGQLKPPLRSKQAPAVKEVPSAPATRPQHQAPTTVTKKASAVALNSPQPLKSRKSITHVTAPSPPPPAPPQAQTPARQMSLKSSPSNKMDRTPATAAPSPSGHRLSAASGGGVVPAAASSSSSPDTGLRLHKSGKYQVIIDRERLCTAFHRLSCKYG